MKNPYLPNAPVPTRDPAREYDRILEREKEPAPLMPEQAELCLRLLRVDGINIERWFQNERSN